MIVPHQLILFYWSSVNLWFVLRSLVKAKVKHGLKFPNVAPCRFLTKPQDDHYQQGFPQWAKCSSKTNGCRCSRPCYTWLHWSARSQKWVETLSRVRWNHLESRMEKDCPVLKGENSNQLQFMRHCSLHKMKEFWSAARPISVPWMSRVLSPSLLSMASFGSHC